ncbi:putative LOC107381537-like protein [Nothobranchius furzeri]|uniref:LOC107381537-like protein n=1 Tax=Nothobranchius furzeri TaxID=105023 RepID=A0A9D2Y1H5_NOTFU|nr:putative LOC107381537-like protein [Nothobranchius furzeri]
MWDQKKEDQTSPGGNPRIQQHQRDSVPALPPKSRTKKLTETMSVDTTSLSQVLPPVPKRGMPPAFSLSGSLPETTPHPSETQFESNKAQRLRTNPTQKINGDLFRPLELECPDLTQVETRSQSLPYLGTKVEEEEAYSNQLSSLSLQAPSSPKRVTCQTYSLHAPEGDLRSFMSEQQIRNQDQLRSNPLYEPSRVPGESAAQRRGVMYAEVSKGSAPTTQTEDTYELVPGEATEVQSNTYESLEDMKTKKPKSTWGKNNIKWRNFLKK